MAVPDFEFTDGFDKYGPSGMAMAIADFLGEWTSISANGTISGTYFVTPTIVASLIGPGNALNLVTDSASHIGNGAPYIYKTLPGNYARSIGVMTIKTPLVGSGGVFARIGLQFFDGVTHTLGLCVDPSTGTISLVRGSFGFYPARGTVIATSVENITANQVSRIAWDITFHNSAGAYKIWLNDTLTTLSATGVDTCNTANNYMNGIGLMTEALSGGDGTWQLDHFSIETYLAAGGSELPPLDSPIIETQWSIADDSVAWVVGAGILGDGYKTTTTTSAPAAGSLVLRKFMAEHSGNLNSINIIPAAVSPTAKYKAVLYADNGSGTAPAARTATGTEITGTVANTPLTLPFAVGQALAAGTTYWIGFINDTSVALQLTDTTLKGYRAANTYASGAPTPAPAMTSAQASYWMWGNMTGITTHWSVLNENPSFPSYSYTQSSTVGQEDLLTFPPLSSNAAVIYKVAVKAVVARTDAGARTLNLRTKSVGTTTNGNNSNVSPPTSPTIVGSYFRTDPNTALAWGFSGVNAAKHGININS